jgi:hypothetical protein
MLYGVAGVLNKMQYFSRLFLLPFFLLLNIAFASSSFADITKDMRAYMKVFSSQSCTQGIGKLFSENHEIMVLLMGNAFVEKNFSPQSAKQLKFKLLLDEQKNKIHKFDAPIITQILDFKNSRLCRFDYNKITDPVLKAMLRSNDQARNNMINDINNSRATYADVADLLSRENSQQEQIISYWFEKDPNGVDKLMSDFSRLNNAMQKMIEPMIRTLQREYDLSL